MSTRREFIKQVGIALASMMMVRCASSPATIQPGSDPTPALTLDTPPDSDTTPTQECVPFEATGDSPRERLHSCWTSLDWLAVQAQSGYECGKRAQEQLVTAHRAVLDDLAGGGALRAEVAAYVHAAFDEAVSHVYRSSAPINCYESAGPIYRYESRGQLVERAKQLDKMASSGSISPETVAQVQTALERDIAFLNLSQEEEMPYTRLAMTGGDYPAYSELDLEIEPEAAEAATFLLDLLSGQRGE